MRIEPLVTSPARRLGAECSDRQLINAREIAVQSKSEIQVFASVMEETRSTLHTRTATGPARARMGRTANRRDPDSLRNIHSFGPPDPSCVRSAALPQRPSDPRRRDRNRPDSLDPGGSDRSGSPNRSGARGAGPRHSMELAAFPSRITPAPEFRERLPPPSVL